MLQRSLIGNRRPRCVHGEKSQENVGFVIYVRQTGLGKCGLCFAIRIFSLIKSLSFSSVEYHCFLSPICSQMVNYTFSFILLSCWSIKLGSCVSWVSFVFSNLVSVVALCGSKTKSHLFCFLVSFLYNASLVCVFFFLMSRTIYQNLVTAKTAKLDMYCWAACLYVLTVGKE